MTGLLLLAASLFTLDPASVRIQWSLSAALHTVNGTFRLQSIDPNSGAILIDAASGQSGNASRDAKMHTTVLESGKFPVIRFTPKSLTPESDPARYQLTGDIEIHGVTRPLTMSVQRGPADDFTATCVIPYVAWGMKSPSTFLLKVDDKVRLTITGTAQLPKPEK